MFPITTTIPNTAVKTRKKYTCNSSIKSFNEDSNVTMIGISQCKEHKSVICQFIKASGSIYGGISAETKEMRTLENFLITLYNPRVLVPRDKTWKYSYEVLIMLT